MMDGQVGQHHDVDVNVHCNGVSDVRCQREADQEQAKQRGQQEGLD